MTEIQPRHLFMVMELYGLISQAHDIVRAIADENMAHESYPLAAYDWKALNNSAADLRLVKTRLKQKLEQYFDIEDL